MKMEEDIVLPIGHKKKKIIMSFAKASLQTVFVG